MPFRPPCWMRVFCRLAAVVLALSATPADARESAAIRSPRAVATLITDTDAVASGIPFHAALRLQLAPGWHTYWQNPGDAGLPPELAWVLPPPASAGPIAWPAPQVIAEGPVTTFAYTGDLVLAAAIVPGPGALSLRAHASWLVCNNICVPEEADFALDLPAGTPAPSAQVALFTAAAATTPVASPYPARIGPDGRLSLTGDGLGAAVRQARFFPDTPGVIDAGADQALVATSDTISLTMHPGADFHPGQPLDGLLVLRDARGGATYLSVAAQPGPASAAPDPAWRLLLLALAGGLILNLMPCVFPVLAMKAVGIARLSGAARGAVRSHAAAYCVGIVLAFTGLGGLLLTLRRAGQAAGWGFQFQSPVFVALMAWLLLAVGLNLSGVFAMPGALAGAGQGAAGRRDHWGSFFTGMLAVLVASPCTAPFMGAAIAGALAAPAGLTLAVFAAMGLGLALPYGALAAAPGLARLLPRPGAWMDVLKQALAFPMYGAAVWLVWVISLQAGSDGVLVTLAGALALSLASWAFGRAQLASGAPRRLGQVCAAAGILVAAGLSPLIAASNPAPAAAAEGAEPYSAARLAELRRDGRPVFVNMTAAWCVSCLVNERVALSPSAVQDAFRQAGVVYLRGDWTRQDPAVSAYLHDHGRDGVPLYIYYPPGKPGAILPQILTQGTILQEIAAGGV